MIADLCSIPCEFVASTGIGQVGKAFRNEISPGQFLFRAREFELMELQYMTHPEESAKWYPGVAECVHIEGTTHTHRHAPQLVVCPQAQILD